MKRRLLLNVVISKGSSVLELLSSEDESLLVRRDSLFVLDFSFHVVDRVRGLDLEGNGWRERGEEKRELVSI